MQPPIAPIETGRKEEKMELKLDQTTMDGLVSKAIFDTLTPEKREELVQGAIKSLLARPVGSGFNQMTELERLFASAAQTAATKIVSQKLESDEGFEAGVKQVFDNAWKAAFTGEAGQKFSERLGEAMRRLITGDRY